MNLQSPAQRGAQQHLYIAMLMYCEEGKGEVVPNSIFLFVSAGFTGRNGQRGSREITVRRTVQTVSTGASTGHFSAYCDPKSGGGKEDKGGLCLAEQHKKKSGICGKNLQS